MAPQASMTRLNLTLLAVGIYIGRISVSVPLEWDLLASPGSKGCGEDSPLYLYLTSVSEAPLAFLEALVLVAPPLLPLLAAGSRLAAAASASTGLRDRRRRADTAKALLSSVPGLLTVGCGLVFLLAASLALPAFSFMVFGLGDGGNGTNNKKKNDDGGGECDEGALVAATASFFRTHCLGCASWLLLLGVAWALSVAAAQGSSFSLAANLRGGVRGLTDRAIREHGRVHKFI